MESGRNRTNPDFPEQPSIASLFPANKSDTDASSEYNQIPPNFSHYNSPFPANKSDTDVSSEYNQIPPNLSHHNSNYIDSIFPPARSETDEIIIPNPTITSTSFSHVIPSSIGPTTIQISISSLFPPAVSETEIDGSASSESNEAHPRVFDSIASFFPPLRSPSNVSEISQTTLDHSIASIFPAVTIFNDYVFQKFFMSLSRPRDDPFETKMEDALKALKDNNNINIVGIYGIAGVGKTTMVKKVAEKVMTEGLFHRVVRAYVSQPLNLKNIQSSIADGLELLLKTNSDEGRAKELREKIMADKRILVILDDVWEWIDLSSIGIPIGSDLEACKSKILLTTRQEHVCHLMGCKENRIRLNPLSPEDSWDIFMKTAGTIFYSTEFEAVAREVAEQCQGLPLALVTVARMLGDKDEKQLKKAVRQLKRMNATITS